MREEQSRFFNLMTEFKKMHIASMLPDINHGDYMMLKTIGRQCKENGGKGTTVSSIARGMAAPMPAVSRGLKMTEHLGYVERVVDREDRRNTYVFLTDEGRKILKKADKTMNDFADAVFGKMGEDNLRKLNQFLEVFVKTAQEEIASRKYQSCKGQKGERVDEANR
ncbi:DNA-binding MarR family transcriptional regulator [Clostridiales Family XIII bacterium PM5-7]